MPKTPRNVPPSPWEYPPPHSGFDPSFDLSDARELAESLGRNDESAAAELLGLLLAKDDHIKGIRWVDDARPLASERRQKLGEILQALRQLQAGFQSLDHESRTDIGRNFGDSERDHIDIWMASIDRMEKAVATTTEDSPASGPRYLWGLRLCCLDLAQVCEEFTGNPFRYEAHRDRQRGGKLDFLTPSSQFVADAAAKYFPNATRRNLDTAMRWVVAALRANKTGHQE